MMAFDAASQFLVDGSGETEFVILLNLPFLICNRMKYSSAFSNIVLVLIMWNDILGLPNQKCWIYVHTAAFFFRYCVSMPGAL